MNTDEQLAWADASKQLDSATRSHCGVFSVTNPHSEIYAVLTVEKVLQDDIAKIADVYTKVVTLLFDRTTYT